MEKHTGDIAGKLSRGISLVSKAHKLLYSQITLLFTPIFVIATMYGETSMRLIYVKPV